MGSSNTADNRQRVHAVMRALFVVFTFLYLVLTQADTLSLAQHQLSGGQTTYHPVVGAVVLTLLLAGLHRLGSRFLPVADGLYAVTFIPSGIIAVLLTAFTPHVHAAVLVVSALLFVAWLAVTVRFRVTSAARSPLRLPEVLAETLIFFLLTLYMGICSGSNDITSYEVRAAKQATAGRYDEALCVGRLSRATSPHLAAIRAYAMAHTASGLAGTLFRYPLPEGGSEVLLLHPSDTLTTLLPPDSLYHLLGLIPSGDNSPAITYFEHAVRHRPASVAHDYYLCALLLDRQLDKFAEALPRYYVVSDSVVLPRHYAEAMILYDRLCSAPVTRYVDPNLAANYLDFKEKERKTSRPEDRRGTLWREYGDTYWWYYFYNEEPKTAK